MQQLNLHKKSEAKAKVERKKSCRRTKDEGHMISSGSITFHNISATNLTHFLLAYDRLEFKKYKELQ